MLTGSDPLRKPSACRCSPRSICCDSSKEGIRIATIARDLAQKRVDADQKRYELGATTLFFVLASQLDFITAESNLVNQVINYRRSELNFLQRTGQLLEERGIVVEP